MMTYLLCILIVPLSFYSYSFAKRWYLTNFLEYQCSIPWRLTNKLDILTIEEIVKHAKKEIKESEHLNLNENFNKFYVKQYVLLKIATGYKNNSILILAYFFNITKEEVIETMNEINNS